MLLKQGLGLVHVGDSGNQTNSFTLARRVQLSHFKLHVLFINFGHIGLIHIQWCSGLVSGSLFKDHSWKGSRTISDAGNQNGVGHVRYLPTPVLYYFVVCEGGVG